MRLAKLDMPTSSPKNALFFNGINRKEFISDNEIKAGLNLSSDNLPALSPRFPRTEMYPLARLTTPKHLFTAGGKFCWVDGNSFYYDGVLKGTVDGTKHKSMADFNGFVVIFPDKLYYCYDTLNPEFGTFGKFGVGDCENVSIFTAVASTISYVTTEKQFGAGSIKCISTGATGLYGCYTPANSFAIDPKNYYLVTGWIKATGICNLKVMKGGSSTTVVATSTNKTLAGDWTRLAVIISPDLIVGEIDLKIQMVATSTGIGQIAYVDGLMVTSISKEEYEADGSPTDAFIATHPFLPMPEIDYCSVHMNRVFGGKDSSVYASAWGDFKTWSKFEGTNQDSYATDVATEGNFTGVFTYDSHVTFFKDNWADELYGSLPRNFQLISMSGYGAISNDAIAEGGGYLMFADAISVYIYSGGRPVPIGEPLNEKGYTNVFIESDGERFYVLIVRSSSDRKLYTYDINKKSWMPEDDLNIVSMTVLDRKVYALDNLGKIWKFNSGTETITWEAETKVFDDAMFEKKKTKNVKLKLKMATDAVVNIYSKKNDGLYVLEHTITNTSDSDEYLVARKVVNVNRADRYQLKFTGVGYSIVYGEREFDIGSQY